MLMVVYGSGVVRHVLRVGYVAVLRAYIKRWGVTSVQLKRGEEVDGFAILCLSVKVEIVVRGHFFFVEFDCQRRGFKNTGHLRGTCGQGAAGGHCCSSRHCCLLMARPDFWEREGRILQSSYLKGDSNRPLVQWT